MKKLIFVVLAFLSMPATAMNPDEYVALFSGRCSHVHGLEKGTPEHKECVGYLMLEEIKRMDAERSSRIFSMEKQQTTCMWIGNVWSCQ